MQRKTLRNVVIAALVVIALAGVVIWRARSSGTTTCVAATRATLVPQTPPPTNTPSLLTASQAWGDAALATHLPTALPDGHDLHYITTLPDGAMLVSETQQCGNSWLSVYDHGTIRQTHTFPNIPDYATDGRYVAWITNTDGNGITNTDDVGSQRQLVGYEDLQTGKFTTMYDLASRDFARGFVVGNGYFLWARTTQKNNLPVLGTIHMTNMAAGSTQDLPIVGTPASVSWPYLLYLNSPDSANSYHIYNLQTNQDVNTGFDFDHYRFLNDTVVRDTHQAFIFEDIATKELQQINTVDLPDATFHTIFTLPDGSSNNGIWVNDRLFMWTKGAQLYAWDRVLQKTMSLPDAISGGIEPYPYMPEIHGNVVVLTTYSATQHFAYTIIDTDKLPTTSP